MKESKLYLQLNKMETRPLQEYLKNCQAYLSDNPASKCWATAVKTSARILLERWVKEK
jgi:hypothetical protein